MENVEIIDEELYKLKEDDDFVPRFNKTIYDYIRSMIKVAKEVCQGCPGGTCVRTSMGGGAVQVCEGSCDECDMIIPSKDE